MAGHEVRRDGGRLGAVHVRVSVGAPGGVAKRLASGPAILPCGPASE